MDQLNGKVAIVTGAGSGIGRGSAVAMSNAGAAVVVNDVNVESANDTARVISEAGGVATIHIGDVSKLEDVEGMVNLAVDEFGGLDVMHANAGVDALHQFRGNGKG